METSNPSTAHSSLPQFRFINPGIHIFNYPAKNSAIYSCYGGRIGEEKIVTKKTNVFANINLDGSAVSETDTGISFLDHMLDKIASHALFDMRVEAIGDINFDDYRRTEGVGKAIGTIYYYYPLSRGHGLRSFAGVRNWKSYLNLQLEALALLKALGDNKVIKVCGDFSAVHDEALVHVSVDLSRGPHLSYGLSIPTEKVGTYDTQLVEHFFRSLVNTSGMTLHIKQLAGMNSHHIIVATFKAFARALRQATDYETRRGGSVPSSDGVL